MSFNADQIDDRGLWLGDIEASENLRALDEHGISHIVTVLDYQPRVRDPSRTYLHICADDFHSTDLLTNEFEKCFTFIDQSLEQGHQVLIHCHAGLSRSATIATMYLMRKYSLTRDQALERLKSKRIRSAIQINDSFLRQLDLYHQMNFCIDPQNDLYQEYQQNRLNVTAKDICFSDKETKILLWSDEEYREYRCRQCRRKLFTNRDVQRHERRPNVICDDQTKVWTFYLDWLEDIFHQAIGTIRCLDCRTSLGNYSLQGLRCSCDQWIKPAFLFQCQSIESVTE